MQRLTAPLLAILCLLSWAAAAWLRLRGLDAAVVGSDSLGPYLQAWSLSEAHLRAGVLPRPPNPESGDWLWISALPAVHLAHDLRSLFTLRFVAGAAIAPLGLLAAWVWAAPDHVAGLWTRGTYRQWSAALAAGTILALDPGLTDSLMSGARGYGAPELVALSTLCLGLAWHGSRTGLWLGALALVVAMDHHPFAASMAVGGLLLLPGLARHHGLVEVGSAAAVGLLAALPRLLRLFLLTRCGEGPLQCLASVARSNVHEETPSIELLASALHDRFLVDLEPGIVLGLGLGLLLCLELRRMWPAVWALGGALGLVGMVVVTGYLQSYHLRILAAPLVVAASVGLGRLWPLAVAWAGWAVLVLHPRVPHGPDPGAAERHDLLAARLADEPGPMWVDRVWWDHQPALDASGVVLSAVLQGQDPARFQVGPQVPMVLLSVGDGPAGGDRIMAGEVALTDTRWTALRFDRPSRARAWVDGAPAGRAEPIQVGGAWDWLVSLHPEEARLDGIRW